MSWLTNNVAAHRFMALTAAITRIPVAVKTSINIVYPSSAETCEVSGVSGREIRREERTAWLPAEQLEAAMRTRAREHYDETV